MLLILTYFLTLQINLILSFDLNNLKLTFREISLSKSNEYLLNSLLFERKNEKKRNLNILGCSSYINSLKLKEYIKDYNYHPIYSSLNENKVCYTFHLNGQPDEILTKLNNNKNENKDNEMEFTIIPHNIKIDNSIDYHMNNFHDNDNSQNNNNNNHGYILEIAMGLGIQGKGIHSNSHIDISNDIIKKAKNLHINHNELNNHWKNFFWTSDYANSIISKTFSLNDLTKKQNKYKSVSTKKCNFDKLETHLGSRSSLHISSLNSYNEVDSHCMLLLASIASQHDDVSHISLYPGYAKLGTKISKIDYSVSVDTPGINSTDQNAYVQSGSDETTPYTDLGITGRGLILGFIDSGADDLSCYLIDSTHTPTPRTSRDNYKNPITEYNRRKVIQYVAYADGYPDEGYDHGTWCGGAAVGSIYDPDNKHPTGSNYNGLCVDAKMTMFDVEARGKSMYVPSLYHVALPPTYNAGVRVHSNSWGCRGMTSYTSKALDIDEFMYEKQDFLFVVAAGNDGDLGMDSVGSPGVSKNALTIGASAENHNDIVYFSGIGKAFNGLIKPDVIGPGTNLMSTGVSNINDQESCNVQLSSGTSMATPMIASAALIVKQYLENSKYWGRFCNTTYRSCPQITPSTVTTTPDNNNNNNNGNNVKTSKKQRKDVSSSLLKGILVHSATDMKQILGIEHYTQIQTTNLTVPPDRFQGWGQVILKNALPIPGLYNYDLYIADNEILPSLTRRTYIAVVEHRDEPFRVTIVWNDPPNVVWAAKNLLNDIDLMVVSPSGKVYYGNNRQGDEFNPLERVVINHPEKGEYKVYVTTKQLSYGTEQLYSIVITSNGYVEEDKTNTRSITFADLNLDDATRQCQLTAPDAHLLRFQLEDWKAGLSWSNIYFTVTELNQKTHEEGKTVFIKTFLSNHDRSDAVTNRIEQFSICLQSSKLYQTKLEYLYDSELKNDLTQTNMKFIRVSSPQCNIQLSNYWQTNTIQITSDGVCNPCNKLNDKKLELIMLANVTDDDFIDYSWHGAAHYEVYPEGSTELVAAGTLVVSDELADSWCIAQGNYELKLFDSELFELRQKHAAIRVSNTLQDLDEDSPSPYIYGTGSIIFTHGDGSSSEFISSSYIWYFILAILFALILGYTLSTIFSKKSQEDSIQSTGHSSEKSPLLPSNGVGSNRGAGASVELSSKA